MTSMDTDAFERRYAERERTLNHREMRTIKRTPAKLNVDRLAQELHKRGRGR